MHGYPVCSTLQRYGTDLCNPAKLPDLCSGDGTSQGYLVCGTLYRHGTDLSNPTKLPDLWLHHGIIMAYLTDISNPARWPDIWPDDGTYQGYLVCGTLHRNETDFSNPAKWPYLMTRWWDLPGLSRLWLIHAWDWPQQPSQVTSDQGMGLNRVILSVAPYTDMGLTSEFQQGDLTSDYAMGLLWLISSVASYTLVWDWHKQSSHYVTWLMMELTVLPTLLLLTAVWDRSQRSSRWPLTRGPILQCLKSCCTDPRSRTDLSNPAGDLWPGDGMDLPVHEAV
jgi:hypothetical protein